MAGYLINNYDGSPLFELPDASLSRNLDINLIGKNFAGYGEAFNESLLFLLQNFANNTPPKRPVEGQLWYDREEQKLKILVKDKDVSRWMSVGTSEVSYFQPENASKGGMWFNQKENKFYVYDGNQYQFVGPEGVLEQIVDAEGNVINFGFEKTRFVSEKIYDEVGLPHPVILGYIDENILIVISDAQYRLATQSLVLFPQATIIPGFSLIKRGINLKDDVKFIGELNGNSDTTTQLLNERKINGVGFNGTKDITITSGTASGLIPGDYLSGSEFNGIDAVTWNVEATPDNIGNKVIARDNLGSFWANVATVNRVIGIHKGSLIANDDTVLVDSTQKSFFASSISIGNSYTEKVGVIKSNQEKLQFLAFDGITEKLGISVDRSTGNVSVCTTDSTYEFQVNGTGKVSQKLITPAIVGSTNPNETLSIKGTDSLTKSSSGVIFEDNIPSTSISTGTVVVSGGVGVSGRISSNEIVTSTETVDVLTVNNKVTSPNQKLIVEGSVRISGAIYDQYDSPGVNGYVLSTTVNGLKWVIPNSGDQGIQGIQGIQGLQGLQGVQGPQGTQGTQGIQGPQSTQGTQGIQGLKGEPGAPGGTAGFPAGGDIGQIIRKRSIADGEVEWANSIYVKNKNATNEPVLEVLTSGQFNVAKFGREVNPVSLGIVTDQFVLEGRLENTAGIKSSSNSLHMNLNDGSTPGIVLYNNGGGTNALLPINDGTIDLGYIKNSDPQSPENHRWRNAHFTGKLEVNRYNGGFETAIFKNKDTLNRTSSLGIVNSPFTDYNSSTRVGAGLNAYEDAEAVYLNVKGGQATAALVLDASESFFVPAGIVPPKLGHPKARWNSPQLSGWASFKTSPTTELRVVSSGLPGLGDASGLLSGTPFMYFNGTDGTTFNIAIMGKIPTQGGSVPAIVSPGNGISNLGTQENRWREIWSIADLNTTSDRASKTDIKDLELGLDFILQLKPVKFKKIGGVNKTSLGLIAQDVAEVIDKDKYSVISYDKNTNSNYGLTYSEFIAPLIKSVQELSEKVRLLESQLAELNKGN